MDVLGKDRLVLEPRGKHIGGRIFGVLVVSSLGALTALQVIWWFFLSLSRGAGAGGRRAMSRLKISSRQHEARSAARKAGGDEIQSHLESRLKTLVRRRA